MSRQKAIEYLEAVGSRDTAIESMIRNFSILLQAVPPSVWAEFFMGLDYSILMNSAADAMSVNISDEEFDELIAMAKTPLFQKHLKAYPALLEALHSDTPRWIRNIYESGELVRLERLMQKANVPEDLIHMVIESFDIETSDGSDYVANPGTGN